MVSPHLLQQNLIEFCAGYTEEAWEAPNNEPILFTVAKLGDEDVMVNLQLEYCPELMADQQVHSTNVTPQQLHDIMEWLLQGYRLYKDEVGEHALSLFYNQRDQENCYALYISYLDATTMGLSHYLSTHGIKEYLVAYVQPSIRQLLRVLARHNIKIGDVTRFIQAQQNDTHLLLDRLDHSFSEVQGALVQKDHCVGDVRCQLDVLVPQLNLELPGVIGELLDRHGLLVEWIQDVTTLGSNTECFMTDLAKWVEALEAKIAQIRERITLMERGVMDYVSSLAAEFSQLCIEWSNQQMTDNALIPWLTSSEYLQLICQVTQLEVVSQAERS